MQPTLSAALAASRLTDQGAEFLPIPVSSSIPLGEAEGKTLLDAMRDSPMDGIHSFDCELEKLARAGVISIATSMPYAINPDNPEVNWPMCVTERAGVSRVYSTGGLLDFDIRVARNLLASQGK